MPVTSICVSYKFVDDWHVFQSEDVPGLYVASRDAEKAYNDVAPSIELMLKLNKGIECSARPEQRFDDFVECLQRPEACVDLTNVMSNKRFMLASAAA